MSYLNLDDRFPEHPKIDPLSDGAFRLHVAALAYCARDGTDGFVRADKVHRLTPRFRPAYLVELCRNDPERPSWTPVEGGYRIHDFVDYPDRPPGAGWNKPRSWWDDYKAKAAKRQARARARGRETP